MSEQGTFFPLGDAVLSECGLYRYTLGRNLWKGDGTCNFIMLNPSTADAEEDDPTIRRCVGFCRAWGHTRLVVTNLFAFRSTNPDGLTSADDPVGPGNDDAILRIARSADLIVCAWGAWSGAWPRAREVVRRLRRGGLDLHVLRLTKERAPGHPLYLPGDLQPQPWPRDDEQGLLIEEVAF